MEETSEVAGESSQRLAIPNKLFFRIGEVSELLGLEPHVLRYWESEFPGLSPKKSSSGQRMFRRKDVELLLQIRHLLYERKFTLEGARKALQEGTVTRGKSGLVGKTDGHSGQEMSSPLPQIREELAAILKMLG